MKKTTPIQLYVYNFNSLENCGSDGFLCFKKKIGIISTSDELTMSILREKYEDGNCWGDINDFQMREGDGGHKVLQLETTIKLSKKIFMKIFGKKDVWDFFSKNKEVMKFSDLPFRVGDLMERLNEEDDETLGLNINLNTNVKKPVELVIYTSDF